MREPQWIRVCNIGLALSCLVIVCAVFDGRNPVFHVAALGVGWFARTTYEEW